MNQLPTLKAIAAHIYYHPAQHVALLQQHGSTINGNASRIEIANETTNMLSSGNQQYVNELTDLIKSRELHRSEFLPFLENLFGGEGDGGDEGDEDGDSGAQIGKGGGFDPISAVANAVGSIFGFFTAGVNAKAEKEKAQAEMINTMAQIEMERQGRKTKQTIVMLFSGVAIIGLAAWAAVKIKTSKGGAKQ